VREKEKKKEKENTSDSTLDPSTLPNPNYYFF
jgi:hypothetical protein